MTEAEIDILPLQSFFAYTREAQHLRDREVADNALAARIAQASHADFQKWITNLREPHAS